ncbi:MAG: hypothetical protein IKW18_00445, partial [Clostridia bacterium]|nr:hypothetical protein [Clostridia bacterium]
NGDGLVHLCASVFNSLLIHIGTSKSNVMRTWALFLYLLLYRKTGELASDIFMTFTLDIHVP